MHERDPNRPQSGANHPDDDKRYLESEATGNPLVDGYTTIARRPRVPFMTESVPVKEADRIEDDYNRYRGFFPYDD
jgi:hypothetical protein